MNEQVIPEMWPNQKMFEFIYDAVMSDGGDRDCLVILTCESHIAVAEAFYEFLGTKHDLAAWPWHRSERDGVITFYHDQDSISFTSKRLDKDPSLNYKRYVVTF